ncbi:MAG: 16S rRNA (uracil(1498)-N(3))-methyltransferase [Flavobacteriaceae bacterium]|nr:16S rRNA (uracil(1498)-N(3))-methyltransferase [Flavobacteriaceae bacterium]
MQLFYSEFLSESDLEYTFSKEESRHMIRVLRKREGDPIQLTNGKGIRFNGTVVIANPKACSIRIDSFKKMNPPPYHLHLAVAPTKNVDRFEWFLEKATEIGIHQITPIICANSERKIIKIPRLEKIVVTAMKQSLQYYKPKLHPPIGLNDFLQQTHAKQKFIAHCEDDNKKNLKTESLGTDILVLIGPEGDFTLEEIRLALEQEFLPISLGNTRLRTETAALVACHSVAFSKS